MPANQAKFDRRDALALGLLLLTACAFVWPLFAPGWIIPQGGGDLVSFLWPTYRYAARTLHQILLNQAPYTALLWNPRLYSGAPFAADNQTGLFYPPNLALFLLFPDFPYQILEALVGLHLFGAGAGMYLLARHEFHAAETGAQPTGRRWRPELGLFPALAFMASDVFITHLGNYNIVAVSAYLPVIFLCLRRAFQTAQPGLRALKWAWVSGGLFGVSTLAGHAQMTFILALACGLYGVYEFVVQRHWRVVALGAVAGLAALGLAAVAILPALEMLGYTARSSLSYAEASRWSLPPLGLVGLFSPAFFGRGARDFWPAWDRVELGYMGVSALVLALFAWGKPARPYWLLAAAGLLIALGKYTPVHFLLFQYVPGFASLRVPARFILLTDFALAVLASFTLASPPALPAWLSRLAPFKGRFGRPVVFGTLAVGAAALQISTWLALNAPARFQFPLLAIALIMAAGLFLDRAPRWLPLLLFVELFVFGGFVEIDRADPAAGFQAGPAVDWLLSQPGPTRIDVASGPWQPDAPDVFGLEAISGIANPLALAAYDRYYWSVGYRGSPQYNFLNAQFVVAAKDSPPADNTFVPVFNEDPQVDIYLNTNAMPRLHLIYAPTFVGDDAAAFNLIHEPAFDPSAQVVLEAPAAGFTPPDPGLLRQPSNLFYTGYGPGQFTVAVESPAAGYLVLAEVWYPGWQAKVNGQATPILRADSAFMAVAVPAGGSTVDFRFTSSMLGLGGLITLGTLSATLALWRFGRPRS